MLKKNLLSRNVERLKCWNSNIDSFKCWNLNVGMLRCNVGGLPMLDYECFDVEKLKECCT